jgi:predicted nucleic acid-binding Zn ribbon protein
MPERLPPHTHCITCNGPIPEGEQFCSEQCETEYKAKAKKDSRRGTYFMITIGVIIVAVALLVALRL